MNKSSIQDCKANRQRRILIREADLKREKNLIDNCVALATVMVCLFNSFLLFWRETSEWDEGYGSLHSPHPINIAELFLNETWCRNKTFDTDLFSRLPYVLKCFMHDCKRLSLVSAMWCTWHAVKKFKLIQCLKLNTMEVYWTTNG